LQITLLRAKKFKMSRFKKKKEREEDELSQTEEPCELNWIEWRRRS
jgi:hypothetical protein